MIDAKNIIGVIGAGACDQKTYEMAHQVGEEIADRGASLVCGGLGGVMEASCKGAANKGAITIGVLPGANRDERNRWVSVPIVTGMGHARNVIIAHTAEALIAIEGGHGTLSEIAVGLKIGKPVVAIGQWSNLPGVVSATGATDAVNKAIEAIGC